MNEDSSVTEQHVGGGGEHVAELSRAAAPTGRSQGYIVRQLSSMAVFGCTCGEWFDGPAEQASAKLHEHVTSDAFRAEPR